MLKPRLKKLHKKVKKKSCAILFKFLDILLTSVIFRTKLIKTRLLYQSFPLLKLFSLSQKQTIFI